MSKVLVADCSASTDAYARFNFTAVDEVYLTLEAAFSAAALAFWNTGYSGDFGDVFSAGGLQEGVYINAGPTWATEFDGSSATPGFTADTYHTVEIHYKKNVVSEAWVDGTLIGTSVPGITVQINHVTVGQWSASGTDPTAIAYIDNVKVGTTRGGSEIFADDFEGGDLSLWSSTTGAVSVADDPLAGGDTGPRDDDNVQITIAPGQPILWTVKLYNQDGSSDPNSKYLVSEVRPENLHFVKNLGNVGTHEIDFELSLTALDTDGNVAVSHAFIGPYRTDFELLRSDLLRPVMAGVITNYGGASAGENHVKISGKDYMHWLETRVWPYDATLSYVDWPAGFRFKVAAADIGQIIKDILETVRDVSPNFPAAPGATLATRSFALDFTVDVDSVGKNINFEIGRFDPSTLYDIVTSLAGGSQDDGGFEFVMTVEKKFRLAAPALGDPDTPALELDVEVDTGFPNMTSTSQTNTGPEATHVLGVGAGTSQRQGGVNKHFRSNSSIFRRIDKVADFGDVKNLDALETLSSEALSFGAYPVHEVAVEVDPNQIAGFWTRTWPGKYANVVYDLGYARIPNEDGQPMKIVSMDCTVDLQGSETVVLGLNQKHDTSAFAGVADW